MIGVHVWVELWTRWAWQRIPGCSVAPHGADPLQGATDFNGQWGLVVTCALALHRNSGKSLESAAPPPLAAHPGAAEQEGIGGAVALQARDGGGVDEYLTGVMAMRTAGKPAH